MGKTHFAWGRMLKGFFFIAGGVFVFMCLCVHFKERTHKYDDFYKLKRNTLDYILLGISHTYYAVNPMYIYTHCGYKGYNLADEAQDIRFSYYWLLETLKTQTPKVVFIDVGGLLYEDNTMSEGWKLKEFSEMRISKEKIQATFFGTEDRNTRIGALFPLLYFHEKWKKQEQNHFNGGFAPSMGAALNFSKKGKENPLIVNAYNLSVEGLRQETIKGQISSKNKEYFEKIVNVCQTNDIQLIPYKPPSNNWDTNRSQFVSSFLANYDLDIWDLNEEKNIIDWSNDTYDGGYHLNYWGNCKTSEMICGILKTILGPAENRELDENWDKKVEQFNGNYNQYLITREERRDYYFQWLQQRLGQYIFLIASNDQLTGEQAEIDGRLRYLGLSGYTDGCINKSFVAIISQGKVVFEKWNDAKIKYIDTMKTDIGDLLLEIYSSGKSSHLIHETSGFSSIMVNGVEYGNNRPGLNVVVMEQGTGKVVASATLFNETEDLIEKPGFAVDYWRNTYIDETVEYSIVRNDYSGTLGGVNFKYLYDGCYYIIDSSGRYLTVDASGTQSGCELRWAEPHHFADQLWLVYPNYDLSFTIRSLYNKLDVQVIKGEPMLLERNEAEQTVFIDNDKSQLQLTDLHF